MDINDTIFFREATLKICGSLEIDKALWRCLLYIRNFIPASQMNLHLYDQSLGVVETVAHATPASGKTLSIKTPLSSSSRKMLKEIQSVHVKATNGSEDREILREFALKLGSLGFAPDLSFVFIDLILEKSFIGVLSVVYEKDKKVSKKDVRLLTQLKEPFSIALSNNMQFRELSSLKDLLADDSRYFQEELRRKSGGEVIGSDFGLRNVMDMVRQVAQLDSPVLLMGETGVGKEVIAGAIHNISTRRDAPFIKVNCGAIPETLMDTELFGHEKGAFTGAVTEKRGRFERAHGGTIFLDEIGELSHEAQVKLLRVIQEKEIERVGGTKTIPVDIRIITATHRDLDSMLQKKQFREDLYYRLKVFPIIIPPLRDRVSDIPALVQHFVQKKSLEMKRFNIPKLAPEAIDTLADYHWPGNVRELENAVERELILCKGNPLTFNHMNTTNQPGKSRVDKLKDGESLNLNLTITRQIQKAMKISEGKVHGKGGAAEILGINPGTLRHKMRKLGIPFGKKAKINGSI